MSKIYERNTLMAKIRKIIPNAILEMDNRGQAVIYTGLYHEDRDRLTDEEPEQDGG
jgi:hypothetical protein